MLGLKQLLYLGRHWELLGRSECFGALPRGSQYILVLKNVSPLLQKPHKDMHIVERKLRVILVRKNLGCGEALDPRSFSAQILRNESRVQ